MEYGSLGRVTAHRQSIGTQTYNLAYGYNLAGQLPSQTYPSGKVVTHGYDTGGRLSTVADASRTFLSSVGYIGKGNNVNGLVLGNGTGQGFAYNDRLQLITQTLTKPGEMLQQYDYNYGELDAGGVLRNTGKMEQVESHIGAQKQFTQKFSYDSVGRLSEAKEYRGDNGSVLSYKQKFDFDKFGNLYRKATANPTTGQQSPLPFTPIEDSDISKQTNRFTTNTSYDDAGNVVQDTQFRNLNFSYDANGRMFKTTNADNTNQANSVYDAAGQRVATKVNDVWQFLIYDAFGKMVAEYGGMSATDEGGVKYVLQDWQGSSRAIVSQGGFVQSRMDYTAFGEEIYAGTGQRTTAQGFGATNNLAQKYALTERDKATGLDHTWFRKLENRAGRWTSPDPYNGSMSLGNPQSFNRYSYVENQPTNFIDPSGLNMEAPGSRCTLVNSDGTTTPGRVDQNGRCATTGDVTISMGRDPFTLTGSAALLYLWNPSANSSGGTVEVGGGNGGIAGSINNPNNNEETFTDCIRAKFNTAYNDLKEDLADAVGDSIATAAGAIAVGILVAAIFDPEAFTKVILSVAAAAVAGAFIGWVVLDKNANKTFKRAIRDGIRDCKDKPGAPNKLPSADDLIGSLKKRFA